MRREGTLARTWRERGPTWSSVFQTVEGGLGYWAGNHFRYGPPKFSMNATPQCYDYEIGSPGWSFFYSNEALPDHRLGIAQLSNRLLIPPDALPFQGNPNGQFLGYTWMALPFTDPTTGDPPTGDQSWTCFLSAANFKGPIAYYIPETWSKIGKLFNYPFIYGRGLDARPGEMGGGAMEINTVPCFEAQDAHGVVYAKIPKLQFPVDDQGRSFLVQDVTYYSKAALYDAFKAWRNGGPACSGRFDEKGAWKSKLTTRTTRYDQAGKQLAGVERVFDTKVFEGDVWGLEWSKSDISPQGVFPQYYKLIGEQRVAVAAADVPAETQLPAQEFELAPPGEPYTSPAAGAWSRPGPTRGPFTVKLVDGSVVTYSWYRFVDQPSFQQYALERREEGRVTGLRGEDPRDLAHRPRLHGSAQSRQAGDARSGTAGDAAQRPGGGLRPHRNASSRAMMIALGKKQGIQTMNAFGALIRVASSVLPLSVLLIGNTCVPAAAEEKPYTADWASLKTHPVPQWLREGKFGIYTHWGVYSVPAKGPNATWYANIVYWEPGSPERKHWEQTYGPLEQFGYKDLIPRFTGEKFNAEEWADLFQKAGARFAGPVAEHHDGFAMWDTKYSPWNAAKMGPKRDVVGELAKAIKKRDMKFVAAFHHAESWLYFPTFDKRYDCGDPRYSGLYGFIHEKDALPSKAFLRAVEGQDRRSHRQVRSGSGLVRQRLGTDHRLL